MTAAVIDIRPEVRQRALDQADEQMAAAKRQFSEAVLATLRQKPDAIAKTREALAAVDTARHMLRGLHDAALEASPDKVHSTGPRQRVSRPRGRADG